MKAGEIEFNGFGWTNRLISAALSVFQCGQFEFTINAEVIQNTTF